MTAVKKVTGSKLIVRFGDGGSPENFASDCVINTSRGLKFASDANSFVMPDCDNPDDPAWKAVTKDGLSAQISGAGMLYTTSVKAMFAWFASDDSKTTQFALSVPLADGGGYWQGKFKLTAFEVTSDGLKSESTASLTLDSDGPVIWVDAAA